MTAYELLFGNGYNAVDDLAFVNEPPKLSPKKHNISALCCDFINQCFTIDYKQRPSADDLLEHEWFTQSIMKASLHSKWPWLIEIKGDEKENDILAAIDTINTKENSKQKGKSQKKVAFANNVKGANGNNREQHQYHNENLLFMISALIVYYASQSVDFDQKHGNPAKLHRRQSAQNVDQSVGKTYSDEPRINNMAKYALCSRQMVLERIRVTVAYIKSQIKNI